jgi:hypothetical protein
MLSPFTKFVAENSVRITRKRNSSTYQDPYQLYQRTHSGGGYRGTMSSRNQYQNQGQNHEDLISAQQYLWDSIQFLSDPYIVSLLATGDEPTMPSFSPSSSFSNKCSSLSHASSISTRTRHKSGSIVGGGGRVPQPKSSPNKGAGSTSTNNIVSSSINGRNGVVTVPYPLRSPPPNTRSSIKPPMMSPTNFKTSSPSVVVSDILKNPNNNNNIKKVGAVVGGASGSKAKSSNGPVLSSGGGGGQELLFMGEGLPPLW